jgi:hypothetical protein
MSNPSADQVLAYAGTLKSKPVKGRVTENVNPIIEWAEKDLGWKDYKTPEPWCAAYICYAADHFRGFLDSIGGTSLYSGVWESRSPTHGKWYPKHAVKDAQPGDIVEMDFNHNQSPDHTEFFVSRVDSEHFIARGGNVGGDNVADNVRRYADMYGFFRPHYGPVDHTVYSGTLYWYRTSKPIQHSGYITQLQKWLVGYQYLKNDQVDSYYGPKTAAAVKAFQKDHKLQVDGKVGPKTWAVLKKPPPKE